MMKGNTQKIYHEKTNKTIDYINAHLYEPLSLRSIASAVSLSLRQLQRVVETELCLPLSRYIAMQRLEQAVLYMQMGSNNLEGIAEKTGYGNAQSLSKAFKNHFGIAPKAYIRKYKRQLDDFFKTTSYPKDELMSEVIDFEGLELSYIRIRGEYGKVDVYKNAWHRLVEYMVENKAIDNNVRYIGLSFDDPTVTSVNDCFFYACVSVCKKIPSNGVFGKLNLTSGKYAVYTINGNYSDLQPFYNQITANFKYKIRYGMPFEEYIGYSEENPNTGLTKIYIPIK